MTLGQDVDLVVVGERHHQVGVVDVGFHQQLLVERAAVQHNGAAQRVGDGDRAVAAGFDDLDLGAGSGFCSMRAGDKQTDIAAAGDDDAGRLLLLVAEQAHACAAPGRLVVTT
jgi:hypothetical protein